jgi:hypothetical protein
MMTTTAVVPAPVGDLVSTLPPPAADRHDGPRVEEQVGDRDRLIDEPARVAAEIEDQRAEGAQLTELGEARGGVGGGGLCEPRDLEVADARFDHFVADRRQFDLRADQRERARILPAGTEDRDRDPRTRGAA